MGRLFWKFFLAFWLALVVAGAGVGAAVWLYQRAVDAQDRELENGPRAVFLVNMMAAMLRHGDLGGEDWTALSVAFLASALTAFVSVKWLLRFIESHRFTAFAVYRVVFGVALLLLVPAGQ